MVRVLHVAEKPSVAAEIASILSRGGSPSSKRMGPSKYNPIFEIQGLQLRGQSCQSTVITSVTGHLCEMDFTQQYRSWNSCDPGELFDAPVKKTVPEGRTDIKKQLEQESRRADWLILWLDCDREGENISFEVIDICHNVNPRLSIYRARFSSLVPNEILKACEHLIAPDANASSAVDTRQELDLRIGAAFTRFQTIRLKPLISGSAGDQQQQQQVISYGPCQFPTLGFVVERFWEIESFVPEQFWSIKVMAKRGENNNEEANFLWKRVKLFDRLACLTIFDSCLEEPTAKVLNVSSKQTRHFRPFPLTTVSLQKLASSMLHISSERSMQIAEKLYQSGFLSYPRTETDKFPQGFDYKGTIQQQCSNPSWGTYAQQLFSDESQKFKHPKDGKHTDNAHPPIHPTKPASSEKFAPGSEEGRLYELVTRHFLACCSEDAIGQETTVEIGIGQEMFHTSGLIVEARNFLDVYPYDKWSSTKMLPIFKVGEQFVPDLIEMTNGSTTAPKLLSEPELITLMDKNAIGTDATMADHISKIQERGYAQKIEGDLFSPTPLGVGLVEGYDSIALDALSRPKIRADMEADMTRIASGERKPADVIHDAVCKYRQFFMMANAVSWQLEEGVRKRWLAHSAPSLNGNNNNLNNNNNNNFNNAPSVIQIQQPQIQHHTNRATIHSTSSSKTQGTCYKCGQPGHYANNCPSSSEYGKSKPTSTSSSVRNAIMVKRAGYPNAGKRAVTKPRRNSSGRGSSPRRKRSSRGGKHSNNDNNAAASVQMPSSPTQFGDDFCGAGDFADE